VFWSNIHQTVAVHNTTQYIYNTSCLQRAVSQSKNSNTQQRLKSSKTGFSQPKTNEKPNSLRLELHIAYDNDIFVHKYRYGLNYIYADRFVVIIAIMAKVRQA